MAKYRVLVDSVIGTGLAKAGTVIEYDGVSEGSPGENLELIPEVLPKAKGKSAGQFAAAEAAIEAAVYEIEGQAGQSAG